MDFMGYSIGLGVGLGVGIAVGMSMGAARASSKYSEGYEEGYESGCKAGHLLIQEQLYDEIQTWCEERNILIRGKDPKTGKDIEYNVDEMLLPGSQ